MKARIYITSIKANTLLRLSKALCEHLNKPVPEIKQLLAQLPLKLKTTGNSHSEIIEQLRSLEVNYSMEKIRDISEIDVEGELAPEKMDNLEIKGEKGDEVIVVKGTDLVLLIEDEDLYQAIIQKIRE